MFFFVLPFPPLQVGRMNLQEPVASAASGHITLDTALSLVHDLFVSAAEREIHTGDGIAIKILRKGKPVEERRVALRKD